MTTQSEIGQIVLDPAAGDTMTAGVEDSGWVRGIPRRSVLIPTTESCPTPGCGSDHDWDESDPVLGGWVRILVAGSDEPARWYCSARCASVGIALAQVRMKGRPEYEDLSSLHRSKGGPKRKAPAPARRGGL